MRITNVMISNTMLGNINRNQRRSNNFLEQLSTGRRINTPSQNPLMATRHMRIENSLNQIHQHRRNVDHAQSWTDVTEQAMRDLTSVIHRLDDLITRADGLESLQDRKTFAHEINGLLDQKKDIMNKTFQGRYIFSGLRTNNPPFFTADNLEKAVFDIRKTFMRDDIEHTHVLDRSYANANPTSPVMIPNPAPVVPNPDHIANLPVGAPIPDPNHLPGIDVGEAIPGPNFDPNAPLTIPNPALMIANPSFNPAFPVSSLNSPVIPDPALQPMIDNPAWVPAFIPNPAFDPLLPTGPLNSIEIPNPAWAGEPEQIPNPAWVAGTPMTIPNWSEFLDAAGTIANPNFPLHLIPNPPQFPTPAVTNPPAMMTNPDHDATVPVGDPIPHPNGYMTRTEYRTKEIHRVRLAHNANAGVQIPGVTVVRLDPTNPNHVLPAPHEGQINFQWLYDNHPNTVIHDPRNGDLFSFTNDPFEIALANSAPSDQFTVTYNQIGFRKGDLNPIVYFDSQLWTGTPAVPPAAPFPWSIANPAVGAPGHDSTVPVGSWINDQNFDGFGAGVLAADLTQFSMANQDMPFEFGVHSRMPMNLLAANVFTGVMFADLRGFANDILSIETSGLVQMENNFRSIVTETMFPPLPAGATADEISEREAAIAAAGEEINLEARRLANEFLDRELSRIETVTNNRFNNLIGRVDRYSNIISEQHTDIGTRMRRLELISDRLQDDNVTFETLSANNIGVDIAETVMRLTTAEVSLMASLQAGMHQIMNLTLLNFL